MNFFSALLAFGAPPAGSQPGQGQGQMAQMFVPLIAIGVMFYFVAIRPQSQRAKQQAKLLAALKSGDRVATAAGLIGTVITVKDKTVTLRSGDAKFEITKASVTDILADDASTPTAA